MHYIRFISLGLGFLFLMHAVSSCSVHADEGEERGKVEHLASGSEENIVSARQEEVFDDITTAQVRLSKHGGRKMGAHQEMLMKKEIDENQVKGGTTSKISGNKHNDASMVSKRSFQDQVNQVQARTLEPATASSGIPKREQVHLPKRTNNPMHSPTMSRRPVSEDRYDDKNRFEAKRLLRAAKEIVSLMNKDYTGMTKPRRKPPINNHVPQH